MSYCDAGDVYCDGGGDNRTVHGLYIDRYADDVVKFIVDRYKSDSGDGPSASGSGSPTATGDEGATTETGDAEDEASVMAPGLGLLALLSLAVLGLM